MNYFSTTNYDEFQYRSTDGKFYGTPEECFIAKVTYYNQHDVGDSKMDEIINEWVKRLSAKECDFSTYKVIFYTFKDLYQTMPISIETLENLASALLCCEIEQSTKQEKAKIAEYKAVIQNACDTINNAKDRELLKNKIILN